MPSFGESLRRQRELRQVTLREVSEATKINIRYLEALERNEFKHLPGGAFTRGYIRAFAKHIGVDETELLDAYSYELGEQQAQEETTSSVSTLMDHFEVEGRDEEAKRRRARLFVIVAGIVLLLALIGGGLWGLSWLFDWNLFGFLSGSAAT